MTAWAPRVDRVVRDLATGRDGVLLGRTADGAWRLAGYGNERWTTDQIGAPGPRPRDEFGMPMRHPLRPWDDPGPD